MSATCLYLKPLCGIAFSRRKALYERGGVLAAEGMVAGGSVAAAGRMKTFGGKVLDFYRNLEAPGRLPAGVQTMNPYVEPAVRRNVRNFLGKFFGDARPRIFVFGINPGRFGAGVTGVTFTDPVALEGFCGIRNTLAKRREVSSEFIYEFIQSWGGPRKFYKDFFLTAVSPLGFLQNGVNHNYYDDPRVFVALKPFIVQTLNSQLSCGARRSAAILLGIGKNQRFFNDINQEHGFFKRVYALEHPRFIMQYRRRHLRRYLQRYSEVFRKALDEREGGLAAEEGRVGIPPQ